MLRSFYLSLLLSLGLAAVLPGQHQMGRAPAAKAGATSSNAGKGKNRRTIIDKWNRMSPEERQTALAKLPPERRLKIEERLNQYQNLTPQQRSQLRDRLENLNQLPPEKQNQARRLFRKIGQVAAERRTIIGVV